MTQRYRVDQDSESHRWLQIERPCPGKGSRWESMECPFAADERSFDSKIVVRRNCGGWCPHFSASKTNVTISCGGTLRMIDVGQEDSKSADD
jgi:hypothetical protein